MKYKEAILPIALFIIALVGISFFGGPITYVFLWLVILVPLICIIYIFLVIASLKIYQRSDGRDMTASTPSDFYITLNNEGLFSFSSVRIIFYSSFSTVSGLDDSVEYELPPHSSITRHTKLVCRYRGEYEVGIKAIVVRDFLGLFTVKHKIKEPLSVIVSPATVALTGLRSDDDLSDAGRDSRTSMIEPDIPVREYVPGDDVRMIHHKATAVMQKMMVRTRSGIEKSGIAIVMEAERHGEAPEDYLPAENRIIESTLALSLFYMQKNIPVDVIYMTDRMIKEPVAAHADYERLYASMRSYSFGGEGRTALLLDELLKGAASDYKILIFVLYTVNDAVLDVIEQTGSSSGTPSRVYIVREPEDGIAHSSAATDIIVTGTKSPTEEVL